MTDPQHRERIRRSFDRAEGYDGAATLQRLAAHSLAARLVRALDGRKPTRILEIGCGTGLLTELLARNWPEAQIVATDFAPQMLERASRRAIPRTEFKLMDAANPTVEGPFDVVCGNLVMQWLEQPEQVMERLGGFWRRVACWRFLPCWTGHSRSGKPPVRAKVCNPPHRITRRPADTGMDAMAVRRSVGERELCAGFWLRSGVCQAPQGNGGFCSAGRA